MPTKQMLETHPSGAAANADALAEVIDCCLECVQACTACADACLGEGNAEMLARCIRLDLDCADICDATAKILSRQVAFEPEMAQPVVDACARAVKLCGDNQPRRERDHVREQLPVGQAQRDGVRGPVGEPFDRHPSGVHSYPVERLL